MSWLARWRSRSLTWLHAAATGDEAAFTELVSRHHQDLLRVAYVICRDPALSEDAAQAAYHRLAADSVIRTARRR